MNLLGLTSPQQTHSNNNFDLAIALYVGIYGNPIRLFAKDFIAMSSRHPLNL